MHQYGVPLSEGMSRLKSYGIEAQPTDRIRTIADVTGFEPGDIVDIIKGLEPGAHEGD